jgi:hypothetical protein
MKNVVEKEMVLHMRPLLLRILSWAAFLLLPGALLGVLIGGPIVWYFRHAAANKGKAQAVAIGEEHCTNCG